MPVTSTPTSGAAHGRGRRTAATANHAGRRTASATPEPTAWSPHRPVLTAPGRRLLEQRAARLRELTVPVLQNAVHLPDSDGYAAAAYARARRELGSLTDVLATATVLPAGKTAPGVVELGDQVSIEELGRHPASRSAATTAAGSVRRWLLVHPAEAAIGEGRLSAASPLGVAILGRRVGDIVWVEAPGGRFRAHIRAAGRTRRSGHATSLRTSG